MCAPFLPTKFYHSRPGVARGRERSSGPAWRSGRRSRTARERAGGGECGNWAKGGESTFVGEIVESIVEWMNEHETATVIIVSILTTIATRAILSAIG